MTTHSWLTALAVWFVACGGAAAPDPLAVPPTHQPTNNAAKQPGATSNGWRSLSPNDAARIEHFRTAEYKRQWGLEAIGAARAYALLEKNGLSVAGKGAVVAVSDAGIDFGHAELVNAKHPNGHTAIAGIKDGAGYTDAHGTHIAGTIAAARDGSGMHGVAFDAHVVAFSEARVIDIAAATTSGVHVVSISWAGGVCNNDHIASATGVATACDIANTDGLQLGKAIAANKLDPVNDQDMAVFRNVLGRAAASGVIMVASLAQGSEERHGFPVGFASHPALTGRLIAVGALDRTNRSLSMACGDSPEATVQHCLFAPGATVMGPAAARHSEAGKVVVDQHEYYSWTGSSHAVPHVSGAVAVLKGAWPKAATALIVKAILSTATPMYAAGEVRGKPSQTYGRGRLNLAAAVDYVGRILGPANRP